MGGHAPRPPSPRSMRKVIPAGQMSLTFAAFAWGRILHIASTFSSILFYELYVMGGGGGGQRLSFSEFEQNNVSRFVPKIFWEFPIFFPEIPEIVESPENFENQQ